MKFFINPENRQHLIRHFPGSDIPGSHFFPEIFESIEDLLDYIHQHKPFEVIEQSSGRKAYCYKHHLNLNVGTYGIANRIAIPAKDIIVEKRDGFQIEVGLVKELPQTSEFCVIAADTDRGKSVITAFPGLYAPPFPSNRMTEDDLLSSQTFWQKFILVKADKTSV